MNNRDQLICKAFYQIISTPRAELDKKLGREMPLTIATYLSQISPQERDNLSVMAKHIGNFCCQPGNETLREWIEDIYEAEAGEYLNIAIQKNKDPDPVKSMLPQKDKDEEMIENENRDILPDIYRWTNETLTQNNNQNNPNESPQQ